MIDYKIRESIHGNWYYHIALDGKPLCGEKYTMVTMLSINSWGIVSHLKERYCKKCEELAKGVGERITLEQFIKCLSPANQQKALELIEDSHSDLIQGSWLELDSLYECIKREIKRFMEDD